jgi:hypothetical protein
MRVAPVAKGGRQPGLLLDGQGLPGRSRIALRVTPIALELFPYRRTAMSPFASIPNSFAAGSLDVTK